jgi:hypothetical protein
LKSWDATLLLEHWKGEPALEDELAHIDAL